MPSIPTKERWNLSAESKQGGVEAKDLDHVAISFDPRANMWKRLALVAKNRPSLGAIMDRLKRQGVILDKFMRRVFPAKPCQAMR